MAELENMGRLIDVGGAPGVSRFLAVTPSSLHAEDYAKIVASFATRRRLLQAANNIATLAFSENFDATKSMDVAEKAIFEAAGSKSISEVVELSQVAGEFYDFVDSNYENPQVSGIPTGFIDLDKLLGGGMQKSDLIVVAARPGVGKSGFLLSVAGNTSKRGYRVGVFSLEMSNVQLVQRMISQNTGIDTMRLRSGQIHDDEWGKFTEAVEELGSYNVFLDDTPNLSPMSLRSKCRRRHMSYGLDLIIVDYLQLMTGDNRFDNRVQEISYISRNLKILAKELDVPVLVAAQLSRAVEQRADKRPILSDLRESGSIEQDADIVMFIHRPEANGVDDPAMENLAELIVSKQRNGPVDSVELVYRKNLTRFDNAFVNRLNLPHIS
jgi:replicative DNA helicase